MREAIEKKERELKDWKKKLKVDEDKLEAFIKKEMLRLDMTTVGVDGNTAFQKKKDFVSIENRDTFKRFLAIQLLTTLQPWKYRSLEGDWQPDGQADLEEHAEKLANSGAFDLLTLSANKTNCKEYMADNDGLMPDGIKYEQEVSIQIRKGTK